MELPHFNYWKENMPDFSVPRDLMPEEAAGMTVNERLYVGGLSDAFYSAVDRKDKVTLTEILKKVYLGEENIEAIISSQLGKN